MATTVSTLTPAARLDFYRWLVQTGRLNDGAVEPAKVPAPLPVTEAYAVCDTCGKRVQWYPGVGWAGREHPVTFTERDGRQREVVWFACASCWDQHYAARQR